jgi:hypothetical protein
MTFGSAQDKVLQPGGEAVVSAFYKKNLKGWQTAELPALCGFANVGLLSFAHGLGVF